MVFRYFVINGCHTQSWKGIEILCAASSENYFFQKIFNCTSPDYTVYSYIRWNNSADVIYRTCAKLVTVRIVCIRLKHINFFIGNSDPTVQHLSCFSHLYVDKTIKYWLLLRSSWIHLDMRKPERDVIISWNLNCVSTGN